MPRPRKPLPSPAPGYVYKGSMETFVIMKVFAKGTRKYVKAFARLSGRVTTIRRDAFLEFYGLSRCIVP